MQILIQRLFKTANETTTSSPSISKKETVNHQKTKSKDIVLFGICRGSSKSRSRSKTFNILCRKDIGKEYFYSTIELRRIGSYHRRQHFEYCMKMKKENLSHKADSSLTATNHVGNTQILPITDSAPTNDKDRSSGAEKKEKSKGDKAKTISKMKELLRWAAASKSDRGSKYIGRKVFNFLNSATLKAVPDDDQQSNDRFSSSSAMSLPNSSTKNHEQKLNWITTDSEFVVLEL